MKRSVFLRLAGLVLLLALLGACIVLSVTFGSRSVSLPDVLAGLSGDTTKIASAAVSTRLPRTALAILVGAALGLSGTAMQAVTRNPLADPGILGISGGAALAVVLSLAFFSIANPTAQILIAILGASLSGIFVYFVASLGRGGATPLKLALAGAATSAAFVSLVSAIVLPRADVIEAFRFWQIGGVGGATWPRILGVLPILAFGGLACFLLSRAMNSLALGDDLAAALGENVAVARLLVAFASFVLCGAATAVAGPIGFVGLVVPHMCRLIVGPDHRWLLPYSALVGAILLLLSDVLGRIVMRPSELDVGIVTALIGAPLFIAIVRKQKVREL